MSKKNPAKKKSYGIIAVIMSVFMFAGVASADTWDLSLGDVKVEVDNTGAQTVYGHNADDGVDYSLDGKADAAPVITQKDESEEVTNNTVAIIAAEGQVAQATLQDVNIKGEDVVTQDGIGYKWNPLTRKAEKITVTSAASNGESAVTVKGDAEITIAGDVTLTGGISPLNDAAISADGMGHGGAGIEVNEGSAVTIKAGDEDATLTATGGQFAAGIGSAYDEGSQGIPDAGDITIESGEVNAQGGLNAAGIGGGAGADGGTTIINGENTVVNATGGEHGAGIGGGVQHSGEGGYGGTITINNGEVNAQGGMYAAGIGSGDNAAYYAGNENFETNVNGGTITINDGNVNAIGGYQGAGIGGGNHGDGGTIEINGGTVYASTAEFGGYTQGAGIGGGNWSNGGDVTINGGDVTAVGGMYCAGIGGALDGTYGYGHGGSFTMTDGKLEATGGAGGAGIGGAYWGNGGAIKISGGEIIATGGSGGAAMGGGYMGNGSTIEISGGKITATGGANAAALGGGRRLNETGGAGGTITLTGGDILAIAGLGASALGGGSGSLEGGVIAVSVETILKAYAYGNKWAIDLDGSDTTGVKNVINGRFRATPEAEDENLFLGLDPVTKVEFTQIQIVDGQGNMVAELNLPVVVVKGEEYLYRAFAGSVAKGGEYLVKNSDGKYDNRYTDYLSFDGAELAAERTHLYAVADGQMLNSDDIIFIDWTPPTPPPTPDDDDDDDDTPPTTPIEDEPTPLGDVPEETTIEDEEVPLSDIPQTGDSPLLYIALALVALSLIGLVLVLKNKPATR